MIEKITNVKSFRCNNASTEIYVLRILASIKNKIPDFKMMEQVKRIV
jgi:hypothetical protein